MYTADGILALEGYIEISHNSNYNWDRYFFVKADDEQMMEVCPHLKTKIDLNLDRIVHCSEFFNDELKTDSNNFEQSFSK